MSEHLQLGLEHPDADQLSAFAENVLPAHERAPLLAHLSNCADCRQILALSLPPQEAPQPVLVAQPEHRGHSLLQWFSGWNLALSGGLAFAAIILVAVFHHRATGNIPTTTAHLTPPPAEPAPTPSVVPQTQSRTGGVPSSRRQPNPHVPQSPPPTIASTADRPPQPILLDGMDQAAAPTTVENLPLNGRNFQALPAPKPPAPAAIVGGVAAAPAKVPSPQVQRYTTSLAQDTVTVSSAAAQIETVDTIPAGFAQPPAASVPLPSHLAIASVLTRGQQTLALDTAGALFLSTDAGQHWKAVHTPWESRALCLRTVAAADRPTPCVPARISGNETLSASIIGVVTDATGASVPGATITLLTPSSSGTATVRSDDYGRYALGGLPSGTYRLRTSAPGFSSVELSLDVEGSRPVTANVSLPISAVSESVEVSSAAPIPLKDEPTAKRLAKKAKDEQPTFSVETANGEHWYSADGRHWVKQ